MAEKQRDLAESLRCFCQGFGYHGHRRELSRLFDMAMSRTLTVGARRSRKHSKAPGALACGAGFTLIELLVVVAIIGVLAAILSQAVDRVKRMAIESKDSSQLRQIGIIHARYMADNRMQTAPGNDPANNAVWFYHLLRPYLEIPQDTITEAKLFISPLDPSKGGVDVLSPIHRRSYAVNRRILKNNLTPIRYSEVERPASMFYLISFEVNRLATNWCEPTVASMQYVPDRWIPGGIVHLLFLDGHVEAIRKAEIMPGGSRNDVFGPSL